jgi:hypothetical protein
VNQFQSEIYNFGSIAANFRYALQNNEIGHIKNRDISDWVYSIDKFGSNIFTERFNILSKTYKNYKLFIEISEKSVSKKPRLKALIKLYYSKKFNFVDKIKMDYLRNGKFNF